MTRLSLHPGLETKFTSLAPEMSINDNSVGGYAALFDRPDRGGDVIAPGAFAKSLNQRPVTVKFLWQHNASEPIGIWDKISEDARGLQVQGRLLPTIQRGAEARALLQAGALDGLSIGFRTVRAERSGSHRVLTEIELWEISLVTFPMADGARLAPDARPEEEALASAIRDAARAFSL